MEQRQNILEQPTTDELTPDLTKIGPATETKITWLLLLTLIAIMIYIALNTCSTL